MTDDADPAARKPTKAERLEAKAARLRETEERRAAERAAAAETGDPPADKRPWVIAVVSLSVALVVVLVLGLLYVFHLRHEVSSKHTALAHASSLDSTRASALEAAGTYAVDFGSYDYRHLDADFQRVAAHLTKGFAKSYTDSSARLKPTIVQYKGRSTASVQGEAVASVTKSTASVLIFLDQTVTTTQSSTPRIDRNRLQMDLVRVNNTWLINKLLLK